MKAIYSELAVAEESAPALGFGRDAKAGRPLGKLYNGKKAGKPSGMS